MAKKKNPVIAALTLALFICSAAAVSTTVSRGRAASADGFSEVEFDEFYAEGSVLEIPEATYVFSGAQMSTTRTFRYPDGRVTAASEATLDQPGVYEIVYTAVVNGRPVTMTKSFTVKVARNTQGNTLSTVEYGEWEGVNGLLCNIVSGDTIRFSQVIDLSEGSGRRDLIGLFIYPTTPGAADFEKLEFTLTDIYDESNYVIVENIPYGNNPASHGYTKAAAPSAGQALTGYEASRDLVHVNNVYGTPTWCTYQPKSDFPSDSMTISMDYAERQIFVNGALVADLDDFKFFSKLWDGFATGQVRLSVRPSNGTVARFVVTGLADADLSLGEYIDETPPKIAVDAAEVPEAVISYPYKIFAASAFDGVAGEVSVSAKVWRNYYSSGKFRYQIKDGAFVPDRAGEYVIEYTATDWFGNAATEIVTVNAVAESETEALSVQESGGDRAGVAGLKVAFGQFSASGGSGRVSVSVRVTDPSGEEVQSDGEGFIPRKAGVYTVTISAGDYVGRTAEKSYEVNVAYNDVPVFEEEATVTRYMLVGGSYSFPALSAVDYSSASVRNVKAAVSVLTDSGEVPVAAGYSPSASDDGKEITIRYTAEGAKGTAVREYKSRVINVRDGNALKMERYFYGSGVVNPVAEAMSVSYTVQNGGSLDFVNPLLYRQFSLNFAEGGGRGRIDVYLIGCENPAQRLKVSFVKSGGSVTIAINDGYAFTTAYIPGKSAMDLTYNDALGKFSSDGVKYDVDGWPDGGMFDGFDGETVWLRIEFSDFPADERFTVSQVNGQTLSSDAEEYGSPQILLLGEYGGTVAFGSLVRLVDVAARDVLDPGVTLTVSVRGPDKKYVTTADGITVQGVPYDNYEFECSLYGKYTVTLVAVDGAGNSGKLSYVVNVSNRIPPSIALGGAIPAEIKAGETVEIPSAEVSDDLTPADEVKLSIFIRNADGTIDLIEPGSLTLSERGRYAITYVALDGDGNVTFVDYEIIVK